MNRHSLLPASILSKTGLAFAMAKRTLRAGLVGLSGGLVAASLVSCETLDSGARDEAIPHSDPIRVEPPAERRVASGDRYRVEQPQFGVIRPNVVLPEEAPTDSSGRRRSTTRREGSASSGVESVRPPERRDRTRIIRDPYLGIVPTGTVDANEGSNVTTRRR